MAIFVDTGEPHYVDDRYEAADLCARLQAQKAIGLDTETTGLDIIRDFPVLWSVSDGVERWCLSVTTMDPMEPLLVDEDVIKIGTNIKFDVHMLANVGIDVGGPLYDTIVMDWLVDEERRQGLHGLKECVKDYKILANMPSFQATFGPWYKEKYGKKIIPKKSGETAKAMFASPLEVQAEYASLDAWASYKLEVVLENLLRDINMGHGYSLWDHFVDIEVPFTRALYNMERRGICMALGHFKDIAAVMEESMEGIVRDFCREAGFVINLDSPKQLRDFFYEYDQKTDVWTDPFGNRPEKWTTGGASGIKLPSTAKDVLEDWANRGNDAALALQEYRSVSKLYGTYVASPLSIPRKGKPRKKLPIDRNSRVHTTLVQTGTVTGRLSSRDPNLQNIPGYDEFEIREGFIPWPGNIFYVADYAQLEMRLMAHFSGDEAMIQAILDGKDLHSFTVGQMDMGATYEQVIEARRLKDAKLPMTDDQVAWVTLRKRAKAVGFGLIYGIGEAHLGEQLGLEVLEEEILMRGRWFVRRSCPQAAKLIEAYFNVFPGVKDFIDETVRKTRRKGYVRTLAGRFRRLPSINSKSRKFASQAERQAVNSIIQGSAGDIAKMAMLVLENDEHLHKIRAKMLLQIHDELIFEMPDHEGVKEEARLVINDGMEHPFERDLRVPLPVDGNFGYSWAEAK
jgi:DNA polymerase-1